jgi:hypothetical protein
MYHLGGLFFTEIYLRPEFCPPLRALVFSVSARHARDFFVLVSAVLVIVLLLDALQLLSVFSVCCLSKRCPARCATAADVVRRDADVFGSKTVSPNYTF